MKKEPDVLELKAQYQFWRDRYEQTKSPSDLFEMQTHLQQYMQFIHEHNISKGILFGFKDDYISKKIKPFKKVK